MIRTYSELITLKTFDERFDYLNLNGVVGLETFGYLRYLNQKLYTSPEWKKVRRDIIVRDNGTDLGIEDREIFDRIIVHHMNPIDADDILNRDPKCFDPENLISASIATHEAIHFGDKTFLPRLPIERKPGDTKLW